MNRRAALPRALATLAASVVLALAGCTASTSGHGSDYRFTGKTTTGALIPVAERKQAQDVGGDLLAGGSVQLSAFTGKVTLINFFASWCGPCQVETPQLALLYSQVKGRGVAFLGVDTTDGRSQGAFFVRHSDVTYPVLYDEQARTALELGNIPAHLPFTVLIDKQGRVAAVYFGAVTVKDLEPPIAALRAET